MILLNCHIYNGKLKVTVTFITPVIYAVVFRACEQSTCATVMSNLVSYVRFAYINSISCLIISKVHF